MLGATIPASEGMLFKPSGCFDGLRQHSFTTIGTSIGRCQAEAKFPRLEEQINALAERRTSRQIHPFGFHSLMKFPRCFIDGGRSLFTRVRCPFEVKANSGALFSKHGANYSFQAGELESRFSSRESWTRDLIASLSVRLAKASSGWIASFFPALGQSKKGRFQLWRAGGHGQFGTARVHTVFGVAWHV
jgi:hypothetical protein